MKVIKRKQHGSRISHLRGNFGNFYFASLSEWLNSSSSAQVMEEGTKSKKTIFIGGIGDDVDEAVIYEHFVTFGDVIEVQLPQAPANPSNPNETKHRGFAFVTYASAADAHDAIDNMDLNELNGRILRVNLARPMKGPTQAAGNRAIWESEEWLRTYVKPLSESGGAALRAQPGTRDAKSGDNDEDNQDDAMEE